MRPGEIQPVVFRIQDLERIKEIQRQVPETVQRQFQMYFKQVTEQRQREVEPFKDSNKSRGIDENDRRNNERRESQQHNKKNDSDIEEIHQDGLGEKIDVRI